MDIRVLRYFVAIAQEQNISHAAQLLHVSQPALSRQIADLETELNIKLFDRGHRQLKLTQEGYYLLERAQEIIGMVDKTTYNLQKQDVVSGTLDIGGGESNAMNYVMLAVQQIVHKYPQVHINLRSGDADLIQRQLDSGALEFGIIMGHRQFDNYNSIMLPEENRWGVLMRADEQLAHNKVITATDLIGRSLIVSAQAKQRGIFKEWGNELTDQFNFIGTYNLIFNASLLIKTGACMALTYEDLVDTSENSELVFRPLGPKLTDPNILIWSKNRRLPNVSRLFIETIQKIIH
ncbi:LysR family transcriptional regulator [Pediococcus ethanolidurans]|uniref:Fhu operon transcription regulator n=1 Tax=Pediococcus ethanolidurans TaxID=319653 RepID=A0A0R2K9C4_9LACO|nr:LysR family transcriptional regulator [Pediococcus ethanolidurans]KRN82845.1 fhu operon transcription regulator [Pediococcus ethanolidurans]GEN94747.1 transcriptional regulator [Pediococcus ethanolidurans]SER19387.1 transcriptional regulator [Pediococcus ethanolidurans]